MYSGFDRLTPPAPRKPPPDQPEEDTYSHLTVVPGKESSPQSSPGSSHSASPAAMPAANPVILSLAPWLMLSRTRVCVCVCVCVCVRVCLQEYFSQLAKPQPDTKPHPPAPPITDSDEVYWSHLAPFTPPRDHYAPSDRLSTSPTKPHVSLPALYTPTFSLHTPSHPPLTHTLPSRAPYLPAVYPVLMLFHLQSQ